MKETILSIGAHNDDHLIGAGGTLIKAAKKGARCITIICAYGESSHPHLKPDVIIKRRVQESIDADELMGGAGVIYLEAREGKFDEDFKKPDIRKKVEEILAKEKPSKIFTHDTDAHPDHCAVNRFVMQLIKEKKITCPVYSFDIWSLAKLHNRNLPKLVVDISDTFYTKVKAFLLHESQTSSILFLMWKLILKDWLSGLRYGYKYAEVFYRLK